MSEWQIGSCRLAKTRRTTPAFELEHARVIDQLAH